MTKDSIATIRQSVKRFFSGTILSRVAGMLRDMAMAYAFGTEAAIASFMLAFRLSHLLRRLFGEGALQSAFIPEFEALRSQDPSKAFQFFRNLAAVLTIFLSLLILLGCLGLGGWLVYGQPAPDRYEVIQLTLLMLPSLLFICLFGLNASLLQCEKSYFTPSVAPVAFNAIWILVVLVLKSKEPAKAMPLLAIGVIVACFSQWLITVPKTLIILKSRLGSIGAGGIRLNSPDVWKLGKPLMLGLIGVAASQINSAVDALFARYAEPEGPALLWYAMRIQQLPLALFGVAVAGAILPPLSRAIKALDKARYYFFLQEAIKQTFSLMLPVTAALFVLGDSCITLIYGRGEFDAASIAGTTRCLWAYNLGLLPTALVLILAPAYYAQSNYRIPALGAGLTMGLNAFLNSLMIMGFGFGAMSVALATSISAWVNLIFLAILLMKEHKFIISPSLLLQGLKICLITLVASCVTLLVRQLFLPLNILSLLKLQDLDFPTNIKEQLIYFFIQSGIFLIIFLIGALILKVFNLKTSAFGEGFDKVSIK